MKRWFALLAAVCILAGCEPSGKGQVPIIRNGDTYARVLNEAETLNRDILERYDRDDELTREDLEALEESKLKLLGLIGFKPDAFPLHFALAKVEQGLGNHASALDSFRQCIALSPADPTDPAIRATVAEAHGQMARSQIFLNAYSDAAESAKLAIEFGPDNPDYRYYLASAANELGDPKTALDLLGEALELVPDHARSLRLKRLIESSQNEEPRP